MYGFECGPLPLWMSLIFKFGVFSVDSQPILKALFAPTGGTSRGLLILRQKPRDLCPSIRNHNDLNRTLLDVESD